MEKEICMEKFEKRGIEGKLDRIGFAVSSLCAVHCALMPFIITFLPLIGLEFLAQPWIEITIVFLSVILGVGSLIPSYRKYHQKLTPVAFLIIGFAFIFGSHFLGFHTLEPIFMLIGGLSIAAAHYFNWRLSKLYHGHSCMKH